MTEPNDLPGAITIHEVIVHRDGSYNYRYDFKRADGAKPYEPVNTEYTNEKVVAPRADTCGQDLNDFFRELADEIGDMPVEDKQPCDVTWLEVAKMAIAKVYWYAVWAWIGFCVGILI